MELLAEFVFDIFIIKFLIHRINIQNRNECIDKEWGYVEK